MILHVLVNIESVELLTIKTSKEHSDNQTEIKRLHVALLFLHAEVDVIVICTEVFCGETRSIHIIIIIHDGLQFVCLANTVTHKVACIHTCQVIILTIIGCVCEDRSNPNLRIQTLEYLVVTD